MKVSAVEKKKKKDSHTIVGKRSLVRFVDFSFVCLFGFWEFERNT